MGPREEGSGGKCVVTLEKDERGYLVQSRALRNDAKPTPRNKTSYHNFSRVDGLSCILFK
jgi:hypothetical protein